MAIICNVPNREYVSALRQCAKEHENENLFTGQIDTTALCNDTAKLLENDVIERPKYEQLEKEVNALSEAHNRLSEGVNNAIEEIDNLDLNRVALEYEDRFYGFQLEVIEILKRNIGE